MEYIDITKNSKKHNFNIGDHLMVKRTIMNECVVIIPGDTIPNTVLSEQELRKYGTLTGTPQLAFY